MQPSSVNIYRVVPNRSLSRSEYTPTKVTLTVRRHKWIRE